MTEVKLTQNNLVDDSPPLAHIGESVAYVVIASVSQEGEITLTSSNR